MADEHSFPRRFGKYKLLGELAQGGMGAVYLAAAGARGLEKVCALKVVLPSLATPEYSARFMDEGKVMVRLTHGNLVQVFDVGEVEDETYIAMEHVTGQDLRSIWNRCVELRRAFPVDVAIHILKDACRGLAYAHSYENLRLVHRDISPPNIMVTYAGETKVMDFGLAHSAIKVEHTQPGLVFGKVPYMSPEQARGEGLDGRTDIYAIGVVLWELLTGKRLFPSDGNQAADIAARARNPVPPSTRDHTRRVPPGLDALVLKALAPDPDDRFASAEEISTALGRFLSTNWPGTDSHRVASFVQDLFGPDWVRERQKLETLLVAAADLDAEIAAGQSFPSPSSAGAVNVLSSRAGPGSDVDPSLIGGRYRLGRKLGEGGMGEVWEAEHADIGKRVAVKLLHRGFGKNADLMARFKREARVASRIDHPGITDVTDFGVTADGRLYFVMELLEGRLLSHLLDTSSPLPLYQALEIALQLSSAMTAAHEAGLVHRDLKPDNVMLVRRGGDAEEVKILDFGIAKELSSGTQSEHLTRPGTTLGTPEYMAPEQAAGQGADARSDVYALGSILYEIFTGEPPHTGETAKDVLLKKLGEPIAPITSSRSDLPRPLAELVMRCLAASPDARPATMREVAVVLESVKDSLDPGPGIPISAAMSLPSGGPRAISGWTRRKDESTQVLEAKRDQSRRRLLVGAMAAGLVVAIAAGVAFWPRASRGKGEPDSPAKEASMALAEGDRRTPPARGDAHAGPAAGDMHANPSEGDALAGPAQGTPQTGLARHAEGKSPTSRENPEGAQAAGRSGHGRVEEPPPPSPGSARAGATDAPRIKARIIAPTDRARARELLAQANGHLAGGRFEAARRDLLELATMEGQRGAALTGLARLAFERGKYDEAVHTARRATGAGGGLTARMILANSLLKLGRNAEAAKEYRLVLRGRPGHTEAQRNLALVERRMGN